MSRMISLIDWAQEEFGEQAPSERVLKKYAKGRMMVPTGWWTVRHVTLE